MKRVVHQVLVVWYLSLQVLTGLAFAQVPPIMVEAIDIWEEGESRFDPNVLMVKFSSDIEAESADAIRLRSEIESAFPVLQLECRGESLGFLGYRKLDCKGMNIWERRRLIESLMESPLVEYVGESSRIEILDYPNDPKFSSSWGLESINAQAGWEVITDSRDIVVAIIDTGVDYLHEDIAGNMWANPGEIEGNGIDDDGNGFVDDVHGYDFGDDDGDVMDTIGHGTHVAGIVGACGNNGIGISGVSWQSDIMGVKVSDEAGRIYTHRIAEGIVYAVEMGASVINISLGGDWYSREMKDALSIAEQHGVTVVVSAGNDGRSTDVRPKYPASYLNENILSVGAVSPSDTLTSFSNFGPRSVDISAPGLGILSLYPKNRYMFGSGTSMAAPHVTGAVALAYSSFTERDVLAGRHSDIISRTLGATTTVKTDERLIRSGGILDLGKLLRQSRMTANKKVNSFYRRSYVTAAEIEIPYAGKWILDFDVLSYPLSGGNGQAEFWVDGVRRDLVQKRSVTPHYVYPRMYLLQKSKQYVVNAAKGVLCEIKVMSHGGFNSLDTARIVIKEDCRESNTVKLSEFPRECLTYSYIDTPPWFWFTPWDGPWKNIAYAYQFSPEPGDWEFKVDFNSLAVGGGELDVLIETGEKGGKKNEVYSRRFSNTASVSNRFIVSTTNQTAFVKLVVCSVADIRVGDLRIVLDEYSSDEVRAKKLRSRVSPNSKVTVCEVEIPSTGTWSLESKVSAVSLRGGFLRGILWVGGDKEAFFVGKTLTPASVRNGVVLLNENTNHTFSVKRGERVRIDISTTRGEAQVNRADLWLVRVK